MCLQLYGLGRTCHHPARHDHPCHPPARPFLCAAPAQESLGGNAKTTLVVCVSDARAHVDETLQSLQFGTRAMCVKNKPAINERLDVRLLHAELMAQVRVRVRVEGWGEAAQVRVQLQLLCGRVCSGAGA
jgi:hypothetical protein